MTKKFSFGYMCLALCVGFFGALLSAAAPVMLIPALALICAMGFIWGTGYAAAALFFVCAGVLGTNISNIQGILFTFLPLLSGAVLLIAGFRRRLPYRYIAAALAVLALISFYGLLCVPALLRGDAPYADLVNAVREFKTLGEGLGVDVTGISEAITLIPTVFYGYLILLAEFTGFILVVLCRLFCALGKERPRPMAKFADWQLPSNLRIGVPVLAAVCIISYIAGFAAADALLFAVLGFILPLLTVQGAATVLFVLSRGRVKKRASGIAIFLFIVLLILSPFMFTVFGVVEMYARTRSRFRRYDKKIRDAFERAEKTGSSAVIVDFEDGEGPRVIAVRKKNDDAFYDGDLIFDSDEANKSGGDNIKDADNTDNTDNTANTENNVDTENMENTVDTADTGNSDNGEDSEIPGNTGVSNESGEPDETGEPGESGELDETDESDETNETDETDDKKR